MSLLASSLDAINQAISKLHSQMSSMDPASDLYRQLLKNMTSILPRKDLLETYYKEMTKQIEKVNAEMDDRIKEFVQNIDNERAIRISFINNNFGDKIAKLPALDVVELADELGPKFEIPPNDETVKVITRYTKKCADKFKTIPSRKNFFHAAAFSNVGNFCSMKDDDESLDFTENLWMAAELPNNTRVPVSLATIDRIIHMPIYEENCFAVLDTSLQVILTNSGYSEHDYEHVVIYNSGSQKFAPINAADPMGEYVCLKCFRYPGTRPHTCRRQCPICLRIGDDVKCAKPAPESVAHFCPICKAYCQTSDCYSAHKKICPRPVSGLHDDVLQLLKIMDQNDFHSLNV